MRFILCSIFILLISPAQITAQSSSSSPPPPSSYQYADFSPSMAILIVVLVAAMFFMAFFSVYIRYCSQSATTSAQATADGRNRRAAARGLNPEVISTFPTFPYSDVKELKIGKGALECAVCLNEFEDDETLRLIPKCDHVFHPECIDEWLSLHTTCPVCRANLAPEEADSVGELTRESESIDDVEAQLGEADADTQQQRPIEELVNVNVHVDGPDVISVDKALNRNRTRRSRSGRPPKFPRSHSTGHSLVHPGENTDRFTLKLSVESRKLLMNRKLNRSSSMFLTSLPRQGSSVRGYRTGAGAGEGSSRGRSYGWLGRSDRWAINIPSFFSRSMSLRSPRVGASDREPSSIRSSKQENSFGDSSRPPV
ncbi:hypothetical protein ACFE04_027602 [Oxalis oulophora]